MIRIHCLAGLILLVVTSMAAADPKPFAGKESTWNTFKRYDFKVDGKDAIVVVPEKPAPGRPWLWRAEFFGAFANADIELVKRGWHLAYLSVPDQFGGPKAMAAWEKFHDVLVKDHELSPKPGILGMSRGALYALAWGIAHPDNTLAIDLDNGFCDPRIWPGGKLKGTDSASQWNNLLKAYDFKNDAEALAYKGWPLDNLAPLAKAKVPILLVYGDADKVVPPQKNSEPLWDRYQALGGPIDRRIKKGGDHHPHSLPDPAPIVEFFEKAAK